TVLHTFKIASLFLLSGLLIACGGGSAGGTDTSAPPSNDVIQINFKFDNDTDGWAAGFADYPIGEDSAFELTSGFTPLPAPLQSLAGFSVSGRNSSDDLFMFIKKKFNGFAGNSQYEIQFDLTFASNAPAGCIGVGGAPGEAVTLKAGASITEPRAVNNGNNFNIMNIDKGNQKVGGSDAIVIGDFANSKNCDDNDFTYELKTLKNDTTSYRVLTSADGSLWFTFSTDSGFESTTRIYYISGTITASKI
ncbi:hypothetical protein MNBD_GAMMA10-676, partial [hydrothermal vent metagenome]